MSRILKSSNILNWLSVHWIVSSTFRVRYVRLYPPSEIFVSFKISSGFLSWVHSSLRIRSVSVITATSWSKFTVGKCRVRQCCSAVFVPWPGPGGFPADMQKSSVICKVIDTVMMCVFPRHFCHLLAPFLNRHNLPIIASLQLLLFSEIGEIARSIHTNDLLN